MAGRGKCLQLNEKKGKLLHTNFSISSDYGIWNTEIPVAFTVSIKVVRLCEEIRNEKAEGIVL